MAKPIPEMSAKDIARFWAKVDVRGPDECWPWTAATRSGYGRMKIGVLKYTAHRIALALDGRDPVELIACHTCDNPPCCNPAHLWAGTQAENNLDKACKGRTNPPRGMNHRRSKLTDSDVISIRADIRSYKIIAADYGVVKSQIGLIKNRKFWTHI